MGMMSSDTSNMSSLGGFLTPLPFDEDILRSMQSMTEPSGWQDISLPGFNWMTQFQQNLGLDLDHASMYDSNTTYLTGPK